MEQGIDQLITISQQFGKDPLYVIAGGGNTSYKTKDKLWVKASGSPLATIDKEGFVCLSREALSNISTTKYSENSIKREEAVKNDLNAAILYPKDKRPSVETSLHEIIDYSYVVHTHPTLVNALMCSTKAKELCNKTFGNDALFVEYTDPGYILFKKVNNLINQYKSTHNKCPKIVFLENHGVFVSANTTTEIIEIYEKINTKLSTFVEKKLPSFETTTIDIIPTECETNNTLEGLSVRGFRSELISDFIASADTFSQVSTAFTPDGIVYCKAKYPYLKSTNKEEINQTITAFKQQYSYLPKVLAIENEGLLVIEESEKAINTVLEVYTDMLKIAYYAQFFDGSKPMTEEQIAFIDNWEVENYRRKIAKN